VWADIWSIWASSKDTLKKYNRRKKENGKKFKTKAYAVLHNIDVVYIDVSHITIR
jgi:hypothetical protein